MPDVMVIGGGPAGISAALAAREAGAEVLVIERDDRLGGVLKQCIHDGFGILEYGERLTGPEYAHRCISALRDGQDSGPQISVLTGGFVHSLSRGDQEWQIDVIAADGVRSVTAPSVVMATGCRERTDRQIYVHGDRPAGVFTAGQAQRLINVDGIMPGRDIVILGSGDIGLIMARRFVLEGARVHGVYEIEPEPSGLARNVAQCLEDWDIPLHLSMTVTEVHGRDRVRAVTVCPVDEEGRPDHSAGRQIPCDTLILSVGLIPENDIIEDLGVPLDASTGGPVVTQHRETVQKGLFVCGNALTVYDLVDYVSECGRLAGFAAAGHAHSSAAGVADGWDSRHRAASKLEVGVNVAQVVPQLLDLGSETSAPVFLRVRQAGGPARAVVVGAGGAVCDRRITYVRPAEMIRFQPGDSARATMRRLKAPLGVDVEIANGS